MPKPFDISQLNLSGSEIPKLLKACSDSQLLRFEDGEYLFCEDDESTEVYAILRGAFVVEQKSGAAGLQAIATHHNEEDNPCFIGEMSYLGTGIRTASVRSSGITYAIKLKPSHLETIIEKFPSFTRILCQQFSARLKEANDELKEIVATNAVPVTQVDAKAGEVIISQGAPADRLYQLIWGDLQWEQDGQPVSGHPVMDFIEPTAYFCDLPHAVTVRATTEACLVAIEKPTKEAVIRNYPQLILKLFKEATKAEQNATKKQQPQ